MRSPGWSRRINGVFGGCWCMGFHPDDSRDPALNRERKLARVRAGRAHAALGSDRDVCAGWCQFGAPDEVPKIKNRAAYEKSLDHVKRCLRRTSDRALSSKGVRCSDVSVFPRSPSRPVARSWSHRQHWPTLRSVRLSLRRRRSNSSRSRSRPKRKVLGRRRSSSASRAASTSRASPTRQAGSGKSHRKDRAKRRMHSSSSGRGQRKAGAMTLSSTSRRLSTRPRPTRSRFARSTTTGRSSTGTAPPTPSSLPPSSKASRRSVGEAGRRSRSLR